MLLASAFSFKASNKSCDTFNSIRFNPFSRSRFIWLRLLIRNCCSRDSGLLLGRPRRFSEENRSIVVLSADSFAMFLIINARYRSRLTLEAPWRKIQCVKRSGNISQPPHIGHKQLRIYRTLGDKFADNAIKYSRLLRMQPVSSAFNGFGRCLGKLGRNLWLIVGDNVIGITTA